MPPVCVYPINQGTMTHTGSMSVGFHGADIKGLFHNEVTIVAVGGTVLFRGSPERPGSRGPRGANPAVENLWSSASYLAQTITNPEKLFIRFQVRQKIQVRCLTKIKLNI